MSSAALGTQVRSGFQDIDIDYYVVLGVNPNCNPTLQILTSAFREKAKVLHPDHGGKQYEFDILVRAYQTLANPETRHAYDNRMSKHHHEMKQDVVAAISKKKKKKKKNKKFNNDKFQKRFERRRERAMKKGSSWVANEDMYGTIGVVASKTDEILEKRASDKREPSPDIPHLMIQYDRNAFHRYFDAQKNEIMRKESGDGDDRQGYCTALIPSRITENRMVIGSTCQGRDQWSHYSSADDIGLFGYVKPLSRNLMNEYSRMGDVTYEHQHMTDEEKRMINEKYNVMRNDLHTVVPHTNQILSSGLQF